MTTSSDPTFTRDLHPNTLLPSSSSSVLFDFESSDAYDPVCIGKYTSMSLLKGIKFSPDGLFFATSTEATPSLLQIFTLPAPSSSGNLTSSLSPSPGTHSSESISTASALSPHASSPVALSLFQEPFKIGENIYDYLWNPGMNTIDNSSSALMLVTSKDHPVQLYNIVTHQFVSSYRAHNLMDELTSLFSLAWSSDGSCIYGGTENSIYIFDINRPGREIERKATTPSRSSRTGQKGIISAIAISSSLCVSKDTASLVCTGGGIGNSHGGGYGSHSVYAAGSYKGNLWLYDNQNGRPISICKEYNKYTITNSTYTSNDDGTLEETSLSSSSSSSITLTETLSTKELLSLNTHGITQLQFTTDGKYLLAGRRKTRAITCWDTRKFNIPLQHFYRNSNTNQKLLFDIDPTNTILSTGTHDGKVYFYNLLTGERINEMCGFPSVVNGIHLHPSGGIFGCVTGERITVYNHSNIVDTESSSGSSSDSDADGEQNDCIVENSDTTYMDSSSGRAKGNKKRKIDSSDKLVITSTTQPNESSPPTDSPPNNNAISLSSTVSSGTATKFIPSYVSTLTLWKVNSGKL